MKREITAQLNEWKNKKERKPLVIKGARQIGKTYSLKEFGRRSFPAYHYINFEEDEQAKKIFEPDLKPRRIIDELSFYLDTVIDPGKDLLIFDEIQYCPRSLTSLKYFCEHLPGLALCCAGSLLGIYAGSSSFPVGKVDFLNMYPLSFKEFLRGTGEEKSYDFINTCGVNTVIPEVVHSRLWKLLKIYFVTGGLPEILNTYNEYKDNLYQALQQVRQKQQNLLSAYQADIAKHAGKKNSMHINRVWQNIPAQLAGEQDGSAPKFSFKGVVPGVKGYSRLAGVIDWLITAGLVVKVHIINKGQLPFPAFVKENFFKLYCFDIGILGAIAELPPKNIIEYDYGTYKGYFAENFVTQEFTCGGVKNLYAWREGKSEVEFVREIEGHVIPIEIKSGWVTQAKSLKIFAQKYDPPYRVVMSAKSLHIDKENKIHGYPLYLAANFPLLVPGDGHGHAPAGD